MKVPDFFRREAETPLRATFIATGVPCQIHTNSMAVLEAAQATFPSCQSTGDESGFSARLWIDQESCSTFPLPKPYVRGLDHLVFAGFDSSSSMLVDLEKKHALGRFSKDIELDCAFWRTVFFPILMSVIAGSIGVAELHCSCVVKNKRGLLLLGPSHAGKSTLAGALAFAGFEFLSDDRAYCALRSGKLETWGIPNFLKLRVEAQTWFPQLSRAKPTESLDGETVLQLQPASQSGFTSAHYCEPAMLVFLDQQKTDGFSISKADPSEVSCWIDRELIAEHPESVERQSEVIDRLSQIPCWNLRYGGHPAVVAQRLANHFEQFTGDAPPC